MCLATAVLADLHEQLKTFYSEIGRPSVNPELMIRMLLVGYCYGIRHERRLCQEVGLHLAYRWFCKLDLNDKVPSPFDLLGESGLAVSGRARSCVHIFQRVVATCMAAGLVRGEGVRGGCERYGSQCQPLSRADTERQLDWTDAQRQRRAVAEYSCSELEAEVQVQEGADSRDGGPGGQPTAAPDRKSPKVISPSDPSSAWTAKANKRVQFGYRAELPYRRQARDHCRCRGDARHAPMMRWRRPGRCSIAPNNGLI